VCGDRRRDWVDSHRRAATAHLSSAKVGEGAHTQWKQGAMLCWEKERREGRRKAESELWKAEGEREHG